LRNERARASLRRARSVLVQLDSPLSGHDDERFARVSST
jgi:hypothetical protein